MQGELLILQGIQQVMSGEIGKNISIFLARYLVFVFVFFVAGLGFWKKRRHLRKIVYEATWAALIALACASILGQWIGRLRPFIADESITALIPPPLTFYSFPSGHTATAFAAAVVLVYGSPGVGLLALLCAAGIGFGRMATGVHYPTDVIAGALLGAFVGVIVHFIQLRSNKKKQAE